MKHLNSLSKLLLVTVFVATSLSTFAQQLSIQLSPSIHSGYNVSCFGGRDGTIDLTITGGSGLYRYQWTTGDTTEDVSNLAAGYYGVDIWEIIGGVDTNYYRGEITLTQPDPLVMVAPVIFQYPNGFGTSSDSTCDGIIQIGLNGGVSPYTYQWNDNSTDQNRSSLCTGQYSIVTTDANGCSISSEHYFISAPAHVGWTMSGNTGTNPSTQFVGTSDNADFVFRTNNTERMRLNADGNVAVSGNVNADSMLLTSHLVSPTVRIVDSIEIGHSIWIGGATVNSNNRIYTDDNNLTIQDDVKHHYNTIFNVVNSNDVAIGTYNPTARLHIFDNSFLPGTEVEVKNCEPLFKASYFPIHDHGICEVSPRKIFTVENIYDPAEPVPTFTINDDDQVGIGTNFPSAKLEVVGSIKSSSLASGALSIVTASSSGVLGTTSGASNQVLSGTGTWVSNQSIGPWTTNAQGIYYNGGRVGIGNSTLSEKFEVAHNDVNGGMVLNRLSSTTSKSQISFRKQGVKKWGLGVDATENDHQNFFIFDEVAGAARFFIDENGKTGIGTSAPFEKFEVSHNDVNGGMVLNRLSSTTSKSQISFRKLGVKKWALGVDATENDHQNFFIFDEVAGAARFFIDGNGKVGIGTTPPTSSTYSLFVEGGIATREVKVIAAAAAWPDYVFDKDYKLLSIAELEKFIYKNNRLPELPTAKEIQNSDGFALGDMQGKLLKKIEEQTLYIIDLQKQLNELKLQVNDLAKK